MEQFTLLLRDGTLGFTIEITADNEESAAEAAERLRQVLGMVVAYVEKR